MKKALSVFLSILMLFAALSVGTSAESSVNTSPWHGVEGSGKPATMEQAVLSFNLNGGTLKTPVYVYDVTTGVFTYTAPEDVGGTYVMVPMDASSMKAGYYVKLPTVTAPTGWQFDGWRCYYDGQDYAANGDYKIPADGGGAVIEFKASYSPSDIEEDTMTKVLGILIKIFGTIIGIIMYAGDTQAGIDLMEKVFGGIVG